MRISRKGIISFVLAVLLVVLVGCPPQTIRDARPYVKDAQAALEQVSTVYPSIKVIIEGSCAANQLGADTCAKYAELDPLITQSMTALQEALKIYDDASTAYEAAIDSGDETSTNEAYKRVNIAVSLVIGKTAELLKLYMDILAIYNSVKK